MDLQSHPRRWYQEPWPWILMAGPATAVLAGFAAMYLAFHGADGLVAQDYYARGLAINVNLARERYALQQGMSAQLAWVAGGGGQILLHVHGASAADLPAVLKLSLQHPVRADLDRVVDAVRLNDGSYAARIGTLARHRWRVTLGCTQWRLNGVWKDPDLPAEITVQ